VLLWYSALSILIVATVFRSSGLDYRLIALGALLPLLVDLPLGHRGFGHSLLFAVVLLTAVMIATAGRPRLIRRRLLCLPIGVFVGLVLSGAFTQDQVFLWPFLGRTDQYALLPVWWVVLVEELIGLAGWWWIVGQYDLYERPALREFVRTGRLRDTTPS